MKRSMTDIPLDDYKGLMEEIGLKPYTADQLIQWLYQKRVASFEEMTNLSKEVRALLSEKYDIDALEIVDVQKAGDGTQKFLCRARDDEGVECVLIPADDGRSTICISTQVGCKMGCVFCRTGVMGYRRDLTQGEILSQLRLVMRLASDAGSPPARPKPLRRGEGPIKSFGDDIGIEGCHSRESGNPVQVTNVVLMGMGEPLDNYDHVSNAIKVICDERAFGLSKKRLTLSSAGMVPELEKFTSEFDIKVAISLNATTDEVRNTLMPINKKYPIATIMEFCRKYSKRSRHRITFEYVMIRDMNDTEQDAGRLVELLKGVSAKVNLIPYNSFDNDDFRAPDDDMVTWWSEYLYNNGIQTNIRKSRGQEILAACGQLATKEG